MRNYRSSSLWFAAAPPRPASRGVKVYPLRRAQGGLTLVEMLVAMAITLIMMAAVVNLFANIGQGVRNRTATMELINDLRSVHQRLSDDLAGATCPPTTWQRQDAAAGYIEIIEGMHSDKMPTSLALDLKTSSIPGSQKPGNVGDVTDATGLGDYDDILALTVRSPSSPFIGRNDVESIESNLAEVVWFAIESTGGPGEEAGMRTVYRRTLLIAPWIAPINEPNVPVDFFRKYDISAHYDTTLNRWVPNTLSDLTKRENRFAHNSTLFPHLMYSLEPFVLLGNRQGEDLILNNALAFDVRVFDPGAPLYEQGGVVFEPSDRGWDQAYLDLEKPDETNPLFDAMTGQGAFVDLGYIQFAGMTVIPPNPNPPESQPTRPVFSGPPSVRSMLDYSGTGNPIRSVAYDTWSFHYENDGIDQNGDGTMDEGANGLDDNTADGPDDMAERETAPPYDIPLPGIQIKLRTYDPDSRQIRESTVTRKFVPN